MWKSLGIPINESSQVGEARRVAHKLGMQLGFDETRLGNLNLLATEMGTNLFKHAKKGELILRKLRSGNAYGIELLSLDRGPGMLDITKCLSDGYSTTGTTGTGLGSIKRLSTVFDVYSSSGGTAIVSQLWVGKPSKENAPLEVGAVCLPYPGETLCGDAWTTASNNGTHIIMVADGLGHGEQAAQAADLAVKSLDLSTLSPLQWLQKVHGHLRSTRGAAVVVSQISLATRKIVHAGVGNICGGYILGSASKSFVSMNGTIGLQTQRFQEFPYDWPKSSLVIFHSDGLQSKWKLDEYPGLQTRHPSLTAGVLYRDFRREKDDVTVLVIRETLS